MYAPARMIKTTAPGFDFMLASITDDEMEMANKNFQERGLPYAVIRDVDEATA